MLKNAERPYRLECWELDPDLADMDWRPWSTYVTPENALERRDKLRGKGHKARVVIISTGEEIESAPDVCSFCREQHPTPHDGSCLL